MSSISEPREIIGFPEPQVATKAVGIPATPRSTLKPSFSRIPDKYLEVSNSWKPSSPKLKTVSTMTWACFFMPSIWPVRSAFIALSFSGETLDCANVFNARAKARSDLVIDLWRGEFLRGRWSDLDIFFLRLSRGTGAPEHRNELPCRPIQLVISYP